MRRLIACIASAAAGRREGIAAVEFAVIAPVLIILLAGAANVGLAVEHAIQLSNAARAGAQYATIRPDDLMGAQAAAEAALPGSTATPEMSCTCPPVGEATGGSSVDCTTTCVTGMARYVSVTVNMDLPPIPIPGLALFNAAVASRTVVARVQ